MVGCPQVQHDRTGFHFIKDFGSRGQMALGTALVGCRQQHVMENVRVQSAAIELLQNGDFEALPHLFRGDGVAGGDVDFQRRAYPVEKRCHRDPDAGIFRFIHDLRFVCRLPVCGISVQKRYDTCIPILYGLNY